MFIFKFDMMLASHLERSCRFKINILLSHTIEKLGSFYNYYFVITDNSVIL